MKRIALVTGGTKGLGLEIVRRLISDNYIVYSIARGFRDERDISDVYFHMGDVTNIDSLTALSDINTGEKVNLSGVDRTILSKEDSNKVIEFLQDNEYLTIHKNNYVSFNHYYCYYKHMGSTTVLSNLILPKSCKVFEFLFSYTDSSLAVESITLPSELRGLVVERGLSRFLKSKVYFSKDTDSLVIIAFLERLLDGFDVKFNVKTLSWDIRLPRILNRTVDKQKLNNIADVFVECLSIIRSNNSNSKSMSLSLLEETFSILNSIGFNFYFYFY